MKYKLFDKTYGDANPQQNPVTILPSPGFASKSHSASTGSTVINSYTMYKDEQCSTCNKTIKAGQRAARPNYPATPPYSGPPEQIGGTTVASGVIFCQSCVSAVAPDVVL